MFAHLSLSSRFSQTCSAPASVWEETASSTPVAGPRKSQVRGPATLCACSAALLLGLGVPLLGSGVASPALFPLGCGDHRFCKWE